MKTVFFILIAISCIFAKDVQLRDGIIPKKLAKINLLKNIIPSETWEELRTDLLNNRDESFVTSNSIEADITIYAQIIVKNVRDFFIQQGLDPLQLSDEERDFIVGSMKLTNGWIEDLSTINITESVIAKYNLDTKIFELTLPLTFDTVLITYDYCISLFLNPFPVKGSVDGEVTDMKFNLHLGFNFTNYHAFVDKANIKNSGSIKFTFTGLGLLDYLIDAISKVLLKLFHGIIITIVDLFIQRPVSDVVDDLNELIDSILHSNSTNNIKLWNF